jgi:pilus assembly protein CpaE
MSSTRNVFATAKLHILSQNFHDPIAQAWREKGGQLTVVHESYAGLMDGLNEDGLHICVFEHAPETDLAECLTALAMTGQNIPTIVIGQNLPVSALRVLMGLPCWDILDAQVSFDAVHKALTRAAEALSEANTQAVANTNSQCWTFVSSVGGAGATLLACETAYQLSQLKSKPRVVLFDLNFVDGSCATYLNCESNLLPTIFQKDPHKIDDVFLKTMTTHHPFGFDLLAMPRWSEMETPPSRDVILQCLNVACETYDFVIVDTPRWPTDWSSDMFLGSDEVILVTELSVPALNASRQWVEQFASDPEFPSIRAVLNRRQKGMFGAKVTEEQACTALEMEVFTSIRSDWPTALSAVNLGQPVSDMKPGSPIPKDVADLISKLRRDKDSIKTSETMRAAS